MAAASGADSAVEGRIVKRAGDFATVDELGTVRGDPLCGSQ